MKFSLTTHTCICIEGNAGILKVVIVCHIIDLGKKCYDNSVEFLENKS